MINIDDRILDVVNEKELWLLMQIARRFRSSKKFSFPSNTTLCEDTGWSLPTLQKIKQSLNEKGLLDVEARFLEGGGQTSNSYKIKTNKIGFYMGLQEAQDVQEKEHPPVNEFDTPPVNEFDTPPVKKVYSETINNTKLLTNTNQSESDFLETENLIKDEEKFFNWFWKTYDFAVGIHDCRMELINVDYEDRFLIIEHLPKYVKANPEKKYRGHPVSYIKKKKYLDEVLFEGEPGESSPSKINTSVLNEYNRILEKLEEVDVDEARKIMRLKLNGYTFSELIDIMKSQFQIAMS